MARFVEFEAQNVEQALASACNELNLPTEKIEYDILSKGSRGLFGLLGARKARIRVRVPETAPATGAADAAPQTPPGQSLSDSLSDSLSGPGTPESGFDPHTDSESDAELKEIINEAVAFLQYLANAISTEVQITTQRDRHNLTFKLQSANNTALVGKKGETLAALQYLLERQLFRRQGKKLRLVVDVGDYREEKRRQLRQQTLRLAARVEETRQPKSISHLNPRERRMIHLMLKPNPRVTTKSMGSGYLRKLIIYPKKSK